MGRCEKLIERARENPGSLDFGEARRLAECCGFELARTTGSHHIFKRPGTMQLVNLQPDREGKAKSYQVRQILDAIERDTEE